MSEYAFPCPFCGSADIRRSRTHGLAEMPRMLLGIYPFRCLRCGERFVGNIWMLSTGGYANCPRCLRLDVVQWVKPDARLSIWDRWRMACGAHTYRCVPCRRTFVSFRKRMSAGQMANADHADYAPEESGPDGGSIEKL